MRVAQRRSWKTHNLLARAAVIRDLLALRAAEFLCARREGFVKIVLLTGTSVVVGVVHGGTVDCRCEEDGINDLGSSVGGECGGEKLVVMEVYLR